MKTKEEMKEEVLKVYKDIEEPAMKIYTIKDKNGRLYPKTILEFPTISEAIREGKIVSVDYGLETVMEWLGSKKGEGFSLAACELTLTA